MSRRDPQKYLECEHPVDDDPRRDDPQPPDEYRRCRVCGVDLASGVCGGVGGEQAECPNY